MVVGYHHFRKPSYGNVVGLDVSNDFFGAVQCLGMGFLLTRVRLAFFGSCKECNRRNRLRIFQCYC